MLVVTVPQPSPPAMAGLATKIAHGSAQRPGQDIGDPEAEDAVDLQRVMQEGDDPDHRGEDDRGLAVAEIEPLGQQIADGGAHGEGEQDRRPVEELSPAS